MFTNLIGFIKPLLRKDATPTTEIAKTRPVGEDSPDRDEERFEDILDLSGDEAEDQLPQNHADIPHDDMELSLKALRHLVEESTESASERAKALQIIDDLEQSGVKTLPFNTDRSVIDQIQQYESKGA